MCKLEKLPAEVGGLLSLSIHDKEGKRSKWLKKWALRRVPHKKAKNRPIRSTEGKANRNFSGCPQRNMELVTNKCAESHRLQEL